MNGRNGKLWAYLSLGLIGISGIAAGSYFILPLIFNKDNKIDYKSLGTGVKRDATPIAELNNLVIDEHDSLVPGQPYLLSDEDQNDTAVYTYLKKYMVDRLGFGPEIGLLKGIHLMGIRDAWGANANGLYIANTNEIFINTYNILQPYIQTKAIVSSKDDGVYDKSIDYDSLAKAIAESIFEIIYHEYGHHMAYCYLNSSYRNDPDYDANNTTLTSMDDRHETSTSSWDSTFLNTFKKTLGYDGASDKNFLGNEWTSLVPADSSYKFPPDGKVKGKDVDPYDIFPLNSQLGVNQLWEYSNDSTIQESQDAFNDVFKNDDKFRPFGAYSNFTHHNNQFPWTLAETSKDEIPYYYSQDELFTRKFMQATMPFSDELDPIGLIKLGGQVSNILSTTLEDTLMYADSMDPDPRNIFNPDYLFTNKVTTDPNGNVVVNKRVVDNSHAKAIYSAFLDRTGYNVGADISEIYYQNECTIKAVGDDPAISPIQPKATDMLKFGGYISPDVLNNLGIDKTDASEENDDLYVGYFDAQNKFVGTKTFFSDFNIKLKEYLNDEQGTVDSPSNDTIEYSTSDWVSGNKLNGKQLFFASLDKDGNVIKSVPLENVNDRASTDISKWWDDNGNPYSFQKTVFHPVVDNNQVKIEREQN